MEVNSYLVVFGERLKTIRRQKNMSQVKFYNYLYPHNEKSEETIKKKMNMIERGKQKSLDLDFVLTVCHRCDLSVDFLLGIRDDYRNYDLKYICDYTGLDQEAVGWLHKWNQGKNNGADISRIVAEISSQLTP